MENDIRYGWFNMPSNQLISSNRSIGLLDSQPPDRLNNLVQPEGLLGVKNRLASSLLGHNVIPQVPNVPASSQNQLTLGDMAKTGLGFVPALGDALDAVNAYEATTKGRYTEAGLSGLGLLPFIPGTVGKGMNKASKRMAELFHASPQKISRIDNRGRYGEFLFFSPEKGVHGSPGDYTYKVDIPDDDIIDADRLFYHERAAELEDITKSLADSLGVDVDTAEELISQKVSAYDVLDDIDPADIADIDWDIQKATAEAAKRLGFRGVAVPDEHGTSYMIDMLGREADLKLVE